MDVMTLHLSLEKLHVSQSSMRYQPSEFLVSDCTVPSVHGLHNNENLSQALIVLQEAGFNTRSSSSSGDNRSAFAIPLMPPFKTFNQDSVKQSKPDLQGLITSGLRALEKDGEGPRSCRLCREPSVPQYTSLPALTPSFRAISSGSEDELCRINWTKQQQQLAGPRSGDEEVCEAVDFSRRAPSDCLRSAVAVSKPTSDVQPGDVPVPASPRISGTSLKRKAFLISSNCDSAAAILRPNLDFEKMRRTSYLQGRSNSDIKKPRLVRIRGFKDPVNCCAGSLQKKFCPRVSAFCSLSQKSGIKGLLSA